ncbi:hypothetical protein EVAR_81475_1 [Eumeta japonica]|uniref:Uncharacterized protein n=1 Tax=Eumeta variegata TaxID=151549 RepID=A0A4C1W3R0_EUMVA|nr:hypothetical protein EVAR_81475_1 [Eumeta japonica]
MILRCREVNHESVVMERGGTRGTRRKEEKGALNLAHRVIRTQFRAAVSSVKIFLGNSRRLAAARRHDTPLALIVSNSCSPSLRAELGTIRPITSDSSDFNDFPVTMGRTRRRPRSARSDTETRARYEHHYTEQPIRNQFRTDTPGIELTAGPVHHSRLKIQKERSPDIYLNNSLSLPRSRAVTCTDIDQSRSLITSKSDIE